MRITTRMTMAITALTIAAGCGNRPVVTAPSPLDPSITSVTPDSALAGAVDITMTVRGNNFVNNARTSSVVKWFASGSVITLATTVVSNTELTALIPAALLKNSLVAQLWVQNIGTDGSETAQKSNPFTFSIRTLGAGVYTATFIASASCAAELPASARERSYTATLADDGSIQWTGPTLHSPPGHGVISAGSLVGDAFSFSVDVERDPLSDDFHGIWEDMEDGGFLNISGKGVGERHEQEINGTFDGLLAFYEPAAPPNPSVLIVGHYCHASDHRFTFVKQ
jgi:hypothetical protein